MDFKKVYFLLVLLALTLTLGLNSHALETDQHLASQNDIEDATEELHAYMQDKIDRKLNKINGLLRSKKYDNKEAFATCPKVATALVGAFQFPFYQWIARWANKNPKADRYPHGKMSQYYAKSIVGKTFYSWFFPLGRTVNIDGVYFGADKIGHFVSFGAKYYQSYLKDLKNGVSEVQARKNLVYKGWRTEMGLLGKYSSGIVSFADMEANYQGFLFTKQLCDDTGTMRLRVKDNQWELTGQLNLRPFITADMDESYNASIFLRKWDKKIKKRMQKYCAPELRAKIEARHAVYDQTYTPSFNEQVLTEMRAQGVAPERTQHALATVCAELEAN